MPYKNPAEKAAWMKSNAPKYKAGKLAWERGDRRETRLSRPFIGVDGEGLNREDGSHDYVMMCASGGESIVDPRGLTFEQCIRFLLMLKAKYPTGIFVGFGFNYDVNMMLKSKGLDWIESHLLNPPEDFNGYSLNNELGGYLYMDWKPRKTLTLKLAKRQDKQPGMMIYDTHGFFQSSFYRALVDNGIGDKATLDHIEEMKAARSTFRDADMEEIRQYSILECKLLVELMNKLRSLIAGLADTDLKLDLPLARWDGAGAIAAELLKHYNVKAHRYPLDREQPLYKGIDGETRPLPLYAYFGGRFESPMLGIIRRTYSYDINSAYPEAMYYLPCLKDARFVRTSPEKWDRKGDALVRVRWQLPGDTIIAPFPYRDSHGRISFPINGRGWYWNLEVREALLRFGEWNGTTGIEILDVQELRVTADCECGGQPFGWIKELYEFRRVLKENGDARQLPLKLGYNSCYGKLAQGVGHAPFQDFVWAGMITAYTRAKILAAIYRNNAEKYVAQIATDGIEFTKKFPLRTGDALGEWEYGTLENVFIAGNGLVNYNCPKCDGTEWDGTGKACQKCGGRGTLQKVRGFSKGERIEWGKLREAFIASGPGASIPVKLNRFMGAQLAIHLKNKDLFCTWLKLEKRFTVQLLNRDVIMQWGRVSVEAGGRMPSKKRAGGKVWITDPIGARSAESFPHRPKSYKGTLLDYEEVMNAIDAELSMDD